MEKATKVLSLVVHTTKEYVCVMQLHGSVDDKKLKEVIGKFIGKIYQKPPLRSSVKRTLRIRKVHYIDILEREGKLVLLKIGCEAGTYVRKIIHDIGLLLGVGAHMRELRRTKAGPFKEDETLVRLQDIAEALYRWKEEGKDDLLRKVIAPMERAVCYLPKIIIRDTAVDAIAHGAHLAVPGILALHENIGVGERVAIFTAKGELVAIGKANMTTNQIMEANKGIAVKVTRVIMPPGVYPKAWKSKEKGK